jgi:NCS1 family nucleobase:cation symporter-1
MEDIKPRSIFTLWFSSNTAVAKYAIGLIPAFLGLPPTFAILALFLGNITGSIILGIATSMGPKFNTDQIKISKLVFGREWKIFSILNFFNTIGWFIVNVTLGGFALSIILKNIILSGMIVVILDSLIVLYGSKVIHKFESYISIFLIILGIFVTFNIFSKHISFPNAFSLSSFWLVFLTSFGSILSWSPYASDYSKGIRIDFKKSVFYTILGATIPSVWLSYLGYLSALLIGGQSPITDVVSVLGNYYFVGIIIIILGIISADALNLYTNTVSSTSIVNINRKMATLLAAFLGFIIFCFIYENFLDFLINFLSSLGYWIAPWIGTLIGYTIRRSNWKRAWISFALALIISLPFINLKQYGIPYEGFLSNMLGGIDVSQITMLIISIIIYLL